MKAFLVCIEGHWHGVSKHYAGVTATDSEALAETEGRDDFRKHTNGGEVTRVKIMELDVEALGLTWKEKVGV